jgi:hypothetical protein
MERQAENGQGTGAAPPEQLRRSRHRLRRSGGYLDIDADVDVAYGDGTPESLADVLWWPRADPWHADRRCWGPAHDSWHEGEEER